MAGHAKAARKLRTEAEIAAFQLKDLAAAVTTEVVMMRLAGHFVPKRLTGHRHRGEPIALQQRSNVSVDRGYAQTADLSLCGTKHLFRREWSVCPLKRFANRSFLTCVARLSRQCCPSNIRIPLV